MTIIGTVAALTSALLVAHRAVERMRRLDEIKRGENSNSSNGVEVRTDRAIDELLVREDSDLQTNRTKCA